MYNRTAAESQPARCQVNRNQHWSTVHLFSRGWLRARPGDGEGRGLSTRVLTTIMAEKKVHPKLRCFPFFFSSLSHWDWLVPTLANGYSLPLTSRAYVRMWRYSNLAPTVFAQLAWSHTLPVSHHRDTPRPSLFLIISKLVRLQHIMSCRNLGLAVMQ